MSDIDVKGRKFLRVRRISEDENEKDSFKQQTMTTDSCAAKHEIQIVATKDFPGYSATKGKQVQPLLDIIQQVINGELEIDGFLLDAYSRWARSDVDEAILYAACRDANLLILTDKEGLMMGPGTWAKRGSSTDQNEGYARDVGRHVNRVVVKMILDGTIPPTNVFPWGIDREYYDSNGVPKFRVRRLPDGRKAVLEPDAPHPVRYYIPAKQHRLQLLEDGDSYKCVPGDPELQVIAKGIFRDFYKNNVPAFRIAGELNRRGLVSYCGRRWSTITVLRIVHNPLWIGLSRGFAITTGRHCERDKGGPKMFPISKRPGYTKKQKRRTAMPTVYKPASMWITAVQPKLVTFLDEDVRELVKARYELLVKHDGQLPKRTCKPRDLPPKSRYFLSKLIYLNGTDVAMVGSDGPSRGTDALRYYIARRCQLAPVAGAPSERVRADTVEERVKSIIGSVLQDFDPHAKKIAQFIEEKKRDLLGKTDDTVALRKEKDELEGWYKNTYSVAGLRGRELLVGEARRVEERLNQIDLQLLDAGSARPEFLDCPTSDIVESVRRQFTDLHGVFDLPLHDAKRRLAGSLCPSITFDPPTRVLDVEVALPAWALSRKHLLAEHVGTGKTSAGASFPCTTTDRVALATFSCQFGPQKLVPCLTCSRSDRLAA